MNRKQGQSSLSGRRAETSNKAQFNQNSQYGQNYGHSYDQDDERVQMGSRQSQGRNFSGSSSYDDSYDTDRTPSYDASSRSASSSRDTDYDLDRATYGGAQNRSSERYNQSSERFGYPSSMNTWRGNDRSTGAGSKMGAGRMAQSNFNSWGASQAQDEDSHTGMGSQSEMGSTWGASQGQYYGEGSLGQSQSGMNSERGHFGKGPKGWKRSDDRIKEDVCETLARNSRIDASDIDVKVDDACVTLSGTVESKEIKRAAEMAIENLSGVDDVKNEIRVKKMGERGMDSTIHASSSGASNLGSSSTTSSTSKSSSSKGTSHL